MKFNKSKLICAIVVITILWGVNILYYKSKEIEKPIFFRHVVETGLDFDLNLSYIEDKDSKHNIYYVKIPELGDEPIYIRDLWGKGRNTIYSDKHYNYCVLSLPLREYFFTYDEKTDKHIPKIKGERFFTKITYVTTSGDEYTEDVGKIYIEDYKENSEESFVRHSGSSASTINNGKFQGVASQYILDKGVKFTGYSGKFKKEIEDIYDISLNGEKLQDIKFPRNMERGFSIETNEKNNLDKKKDIADFYIMTLNLSFESSKGEKTVVPFNISNQRQVMNYGDVKKEDVENLIKIRRGE